MPQNRITVQIALKPYLKAFLLSIYGGPEPLFFPKKDKFSDLLAFLIAKAPADHVPEKRDPEKLQVILPYFEHINILSYNYLSEKSQVIFENRVSNRFWVIFEDFMDKCFQKNIRRSEAIALFIEKYQLPYDATIEDMLRKAIYRSMRLQKKYPVRKYTKTP